MINGLKDRKFDISSSARRIILVAALAVFGIVTAVGGVYAASKRVTIADGENSSKEVTTFKRYVDDVLESNGIALYDGDKLNVERDSRIKDNMTIEIYRAFTVGVTEMGERKEYRTTKHTVGEALAELGLNAKDTDKTTPGFYDEISANTEILLIRTSQDIVEISEEIPYECKEKINKGLASGQQKLVQEGKTGEKKVSYRIAYEDGIEVAREKISEEVVSEPVEQVKEIGPRKKIEHYQIASAGAIQTSRSGNLAYSRVITANASAYDASSCGKSASHSGYGVTATGAAAVKGVVAVDPSVIPLGTRMYIESADGSYVYGTAVAADTGSAIKGNRIDLCFNTRAEALGFGRRSVKVYILN